MIYSEVVVQVLMQNLYRRWKVLILFWNSVLLTSSYIIFIASQIFQLGLLSTAGQYTLYSRNEILVWSALAPFFKMYYRIKILTQVNSYIWMLIFEKGPPKRSLLHFILAFLMRFDKKFYILNLWGAHRPFAKVQRIKSCL